MTTETIRTIRNNGNTFEVITDGEKVQVSYDMRVWTELLEMEANEAEAVANAMLEAVKEIRQNVDKDIKWKYSPAVIPLATGNSNE